MKSEGVEVAANCIGATVEMSITFEGEEIPCWVWMESAEARELAAELIAAADRAEGV